MNRINQFSKQKHWISYSQITLDQNLRVPLFIGDGHASL